MKKAILIIAATIVSLSLSAQSIAFLNINPDPVTAGVAGTGIARTADAYAVENNIAAAALNGPKMAAAAGFGMWQPKAANTKLISAAGYYRITDRFALGVQFKDMSYPAYSNVSGDGRIRDSFSPMELTAALGAAYRIADGFSAGVNLRFIRSSLAETAKASAFGADIALKYEKDAFQAGLSVCNLGTPVSYGEDKYAQPGIARLGAAYSIAGLTASVEADYLFAGGLMAGIGLEYTFADIVSVRAGFHYGDPAKAMPMYASLGLGVQFAGFRLDAAFLTASKTVGNTLLLGLGYSF